jgi:hypothetical protein
MGRANISMPKLRELLLLTVFDLNFTWSYHTLTGIAVIAIARQNSIFVIPCCAATVTIDPNTPMINYY